ncbi:hypothetical protein KKH3_05460 [Pectobacterium actinidiae]|nr:hypothetical protein KKH3_05460 [Pectobacterium actinidiae]
MAQTLYSSIPLLPFSFGKKVRQHSEPVQYEIGLIVFT